MQGEGGKQFFSPQMVRECYLFFPLSSLCRLLCFPFSFGDFGFKVLPLRSAKKMISENKILTVAEDEVDLILLALNLDEC